MKKIIITIDKYVQYEFDASKYTEDEAVNLALELFDESDETICVDYEREGEE